MSEFEFGLQNVLELREKEEKERMRELAAAQRAAEEAVRQRAALERIRAEQADRLLTAHTESASVGHLRNLAVVMSRLGQQVQDADRAVQSAEKAVEDRRSDLSSAMVSRKALDTLRGKLRDAWRKQTQNREQQSMDEVALGLFQRQVANAQRGS